MKCREMQENFSAFLDGELEPAAKQQVQGHLDGCAVCRKEFELYRKSWDLLKVWQEKEPAPGYIGRFWSKLAQEKTWSEKIFDNFRNVFTQRALAPVLITACVFVMVGSFSYRQHLSSLKTENMLAAMAPEEIELVDHLELVQNFDVIEDMDAVENLEIVESLDAV